MALVAGCFTFSVSAFAADAEPMDAPKDKPAAAKPHHVMKKHAAAKKMAPKKAMKEETAK